MASGILSRPPGIVCTQSQGFAVLAGGGSHVPRVFCASNFGQPLVSAPITPFPPCPFPPPSPQSTNPVVVEPVAPVRRTTGGALDGWFLRPCTKTLISRFFVVALGTESTTFVNGLGLLAS